MPGGSLKKIHHHADEQEQIHDEHSSVQNQGQIIPLAFHRVRPFPLVFNRLVQDRVLVVVLQRITKTTIRNENKLKMFLRFFAIFATGGLQMYTLSDREFRLRSLPMFYL